MKTSFRFPPVLRRTGVIVAGGLIAGRELHAALDAAKIPVAVSLTWLGALAEARKNPGALVICFDFDELDEAPLLAARLSELEGPSGEPPGLVVVADAIDEGISQAGWTGPLDRVRFARMRSLASDFSFAVSELLHEQSVDDAEAWVEVLGAEAAPQAGVGAAFDLDALEAELHDALAWTAPLIERVGDQLEARLRLDEVRGPAGDGLEGRLHAAWRDAAGQVFRVALSARQPPGPGFELERAEGLGGFFARLGATPLGIEALDTRFVARGEEAGRQAARAVGRELASLADDGLTCRATGGVLEASCEAVPRAELGRVAGRLVTLWRALALVRLDATAASARELTPG